MLRLACEEAARKAQPVQPPHALHDASHSERSGHGTKRRRLDSPVTGSDDEAIVVPSSPAPSGSPTSDTLPGALLSHPSACVSWTVAAVLVLSRCTLELGRRAVQIKCTLWPVYVYGAPAYEPRECVSCVSRGQKPLLLDSSARLMTNGVRGLRAIHVAFARWTPHSCRAYGSYTSDINAEPAIRGYAATLSLPGLYTSVTCADQSPTRHRALSSMPEAGVLPEDQWAPR